MTEVAGTLQLQASAVFIVFPKKSAEDWTEEMLVTS